MSAADSGGGDPILDGSAVLPHLRHMSAWSSGKPQATDDSRIVPDLQYRQTHPRCASLNDQNEARASATCAGSENRPMAHTLAAQRSM